MFGVVRNLAINDQVRVSTSGNSQRAVICRPSWLSFMTIGQNPQLILGKEIDESYP